MDSQQSKLLIIDSDDNVGVALRQFSPKETVKFDSTEIKVQEEIKAGFKIALTDINNGEKIIKYGEVIGQATAPIKCGELVHVHNVEGIRGRGDKMTGSEIA